MVIPYAGTTGATYWRMYDKTYDALYDDPDNPALSSIVIGDLPPKGTPLALKQESGEDTLTPVSKIEVYDNAVLIMGFVKPRNTYAVAVLKVEDSKPVDLKFDLLENIFKSQQGDIGDNPTDMATTEYVDNAVSGKVSGSSVGQAPAILSATSVYASDWATLSSTADENTMYVVLPDPVLPTRVKYTTSSGLSDWEGDIVGSLDGTEEAGGVFGPTPQIPNVTYAEDVTIGSNLSAIGAYAFFVEEEGLPLKSVTIGNSVTSIGNCAFEYCSGLSSMIIPDSVTSIGESAFG